MNFETLATGPENLDPMVQKDFYNSIGPKLTVPINTPMSAQTRKADISGITANVRDGQKQTPNPFGGKLQRRVTQPDHAGIKLPETLKAAG